VDTKNDEIDIRLLRALAMGGKTSAEIQLLVDSQVGDKANFQALALLVSNLSVPEKRAQVTFEKLRQHQERMREQLGRAVGIKTAALDYVEYVERGMNLRDDEQALSYAQLSQMAFQDQLSGLANFRFFSQRFTEEIKRAQRYQQLLSLLMIDIDHFKAFNDTHGHLCGNRALEHVARILKSEVRETDIVARYGGEEFAIILPQTTKHDAFALSEAIRKKIEHSPVAIPQKGMKAVSVSIGVATYPRDARSGEALIGGADAALYASKKAGRNRVSEFLPASSLMFSYKPEKPALVQNVSVVADFNGWHKNVDLMKPDGSGRYTLKVNLTPGQYAYKFVLNGERYIGDPNCSRSVQDGYGGRNSLVSVE